MTALELRPYQREAIDRIRAAEARGIRRQLGVAATGLGKTIVFASLAREMGCRTLVLAHRDELVAQAVEKIQGQWPEATIGVVKAGRNEVDGDVVVASVQTLARPNRMKDLLGHGDGLLKREPFGLVIADEAHHYRSELWGGVLNTLGCGQPDGPLLLGVTATPDRGDGKGLDDVFQEVTWTYDILWGIRSGFLCDVRGRRITIDTLDLKGVKVRQGDYAEGEVGNRMMDAGAPEAIFRAWSEHAADRRTLIFSPTVETAEAIAAEFIGGGVSCGFVSAKTPLEERRQMLRDFDTGAIQVMSNCFDMETEILTPTGWRGADEVAVGDTVAAVDPDTGELRWEPVTHTVRRATVGDERMVAIRNQTLNLRVTEGHRMLVRTAGAKAWRIDNAVTLPDRLSPYQFRVAAHGSFPGVDLTDDDLRFLGLFATDGSLNKERASIEIAQAAGSPMCAEIERILSGCGFDWKVHEHLGTTPAGEVKTYRRYRIPKGNIGGQLARNGWVRLAGWLDKSLHPDLAECTVEQFKALLNGLWIGDGLKSHRADRPNDGTTICGADRVLLDRVQAWAVTRGMACSQSWYPNTGGGLLGYVTVRNRDIVTTNNRWVPTSGGNPARFEEPDVEEVWCVTNATGTVIARRAGRVMVAGQCMVLTEGYDNPRVDCVLVARPTKSRALYCFDAATEVLTPFGWVAGRTVKEGDTIAAFDPEDGAVRWEQVLATVERPLLDGERMMELRSPSIDIRVTDTHRMVWRRRAGRSRERTAWQVSTAGELAARADVWDLPAAGIEKSTGVPLTHDELRFVAWVQTDGCVNRANWAIQISQSEGPLADEVRRVLTSCGMRWSESVRTEPTNLGPRRKPLVVFAVSRGQWRHLRAWLPKVDGSGVWRHLEKMDGEQWAEFLAAWHDGDGSKQVGQSWTRRSYHLAIADEWVAGWVQAMCMRRGWRANVAKQANLWIVHCREGVSRFVGGASSKDRPRLVPSEEVAGELVWCVSVPSGAILTRRNGKGAVVGQTQMVGRGTRRHPDKADLLVLDVVGVSDHHSLVTIPSLFGVEQREFERKLADGEGLVTEVLDEIEEILVRQGKLLAAEAELFKKMRSTIVWVQVHTNGSPLRRYERSTGRDRDGTARPTVRLTQLHPNVDRWSCSLQTPTAGGSDLKSLIADVTLEVAQGVGEDYLRKSGAMALVAADAPWRGAGPSQKQLDFAAKLGIVGGADMTKGELSNLIDAKMAQKRASGGGRGYNRGRR